jgi:hypothetical protein|uniref:Uncharacterized protein n=1 Tax=Oryza nivara TaxID=4536 RepID=A0A0E0FPP6_ORYNI
MPFLPGNSTAGGKPQLVRSYKHIVDGFTAIAVSKKPDFRRCFQDGIACLHCWFKQEGGWQPCLIRPW